MQIDMQKLEVAMKYIERIADGKNPVNNKPTEEDSVLNNPNVVMPVLMNHYVMLQRNLIYTGITRAKKILVMVGTKKALSYAVRNVTVTKRNTFLKTESTWHNDGIPCIVNKFIRRRDIFI